MKPESNNDPVDVIGSIVKDFASDFPKERHNNQKPFLLLLGGFQGSGKTTVLELLKNKLDFTLISLDKVRNLLLKQRPNAFESVSSIVSVIRDKLAIEAVRKGLSFAIDTNATPKRVRYLKTLVKEHGDNYQVITVFLDTPEDKSIGRIQSRKVQNGYYQGTVDEYRASSGQYGEIEDSDYDLIVETAKLKPNEIIDAIEEKVKEKLEDPSSGFPF